MKIGELARRTGISTATVRFYEQLGLLESPERAANGYRRYAPESANRIRFIRDAQAAGLSLADIGLIFDMKAEGESTCGHVILLLEEHLAAVDRQAAELARTRARLQTMLDRARDLDPAECVDPNRCQTITSAEHTERNEMTTRTQLSVPEIHCDHCKMALEGAVGAMAGVTSVEVSVPEATVDVAYDDDVVALDSIKEVIEEQGYAVAN